MQKNNTFFVDKIPRNFSYFLNFYTMIETHDFYDSYSESNDNLIISCPHAHIGKFMNDNVTRIIKTIAYLPDNIRQNGDPHTHELLENFAELSFGHGIRSTLSSKSVNLNRSNVFIEGEMKDQMAYQIKNLAINLAYLRNKDHKIKLSNDFNIKNGKIYLESLDRVDFEKQKSTNQNFSMNAIATAIQYFYEYHTEFTKEELKKGAQSLVLELHSCSSQSEVSHGGGIVIGTNYGQSISDIEHEILLAQKLFEKGYKVVLTDLDHFFGMRDRLKKLLTGEQLENFSPKSAKFFGKDVITDKRKFIESQTKNLADVFQIEIAPKYRETEDARKKLAEDLVTISEEILK